VVQYVVLQAVESQMAILQLPTSVVSAGIVDMVQLSVVMERRLHVFMRLLMRTGVVGDAYSRRVE
jgi:hypothetical protein